MVDRLRRKKLAFHLRHLSIGLIHNDDFECYVMDDVTNGWLPEQYYRAKEAKFDDPAIVPLLEMCWCLYSDLDEQKLTGSKKLDNKTLKDIARCILFLQSGREYEWPYFDITNPLLKLSFPQIILSILTLGIYYRKILLQKKKQFEEYKQLGDFDYWPFLRKSDYVEQLTMPPFLSRVV